MPFSVGGRPVNFTGLKWISIKQVSSQTVWNKGAFRNQWYSFNIGATSVTWAELIFMPLFHLFFPYIFHIWGQLEYPEILWCKLVAGPKS
jgi:hypothetical protein